MPAPKLAIDTMLPAPRTLGTLLAGAMELPLPAGTLPERWMHGVAWNPHPCRDPLAGAVNTCSPANFTDPNYGCVAAVEQEAFQMYDAFEGALLEFDPADIDAKLRARQQNWVSWAMARELLSGAASGGLSLSSEATAPTGIAFGSAATPIVNAIRVLESELTERLHNGVGVIHIPPAMLATASEEAGVFAVGDRFFTPLGTLVIADGGYANAPAPTGEAASPDGEDWAYASGPVWYRLSDPELIGGTDWLDRPRNHLMRFIDQYGLLVFDPCPVTAVLATY